MVVIIIFVVVKSVSGCGGICVLNFSDFKSCKCFCLDVVAFFHYSTAVCLHWKLVFCEIKYRIFVKTCLKVGGYLRLIHNKLDSWYA